MDFKGLSLTRLSSGYTIKPFDCGDVDLNDFLHKDCHNYQTKLLAVTYLLESDTETIAFFSLLNDKISVVDCESKRSFTRKFKDLMPAGKKFTSYPAMKIGRFGVSNSYQKGGYGTALLDYIKQMFIDKNRTGCKFITVDAYAKSLSFYEKNEFIYLTSTDEKEDTRLMYFDLVNIT